MKQHVLTVYIVCLAILAGGCVYPAFANIPAPSFVVNSLKFTQNKGQVLDEQGHVRQDILFTGQGEGVQFFLTRQGIIHSYKKVHQGKLTTRQVQMHLIGANHEAEIVADQPTADVQNYFSAAYPKGITGVRSYRKVVYKEIYPHIDFVLYTDGAGIKYDFVVRPGGKVSDIRFTYKGDSHVKLTGKGSLVVRNPLGKLTEGVPFTYQVPGPDTVQVASAYRLQQGVVSFRVGSYNKLHTITIDPAIAWATYYGGEKDEFLTVKPDKQGNLYGVGYTRSSNRISYNGYVSTIPNAGKKSCLLVKFNNQHQLVWATYYGTDAGAGAGALAVDNDGHVYITGSVETGGSIPATAPLKSVHAGGTDSFVARFSTDGIPEWATYYGGSKDEFVQGIVVDGSSSSVYITGYTTSSNDNEAIATAGAYRTNPYNPNTCPWPVPNGCFADRDVFLAKFSSSGQRIWSTYYGGETSDHASGIAVDNESNIYIHGRTTSVSPADAISFNNNLQKERTPNDENSDAFIAKFNPQGVRVWGTYFGGKRWDDIKSITFDERNNMYLAGETFSLDIFSNKEVKGPNRHKTKLVYGNDPVMDAFIARINRDYTVQWATYYGGKRWDAGLKIIYNGKGSIYVSGYTESITENATESISTGNLVSRYGLKSVHSNSSSEDAFIVKFDTAGVRIWGAYYGGTKRDIGNSLALAPDGKIYLSGVAESVIPMPPTARESTIGSQTEEDGYIALIDDEDPVVAGVSPSHTSIDVPINSSLEITFSEVPAIGSGDIIIKQGNGEARQLPITSLPVQVQGNKVIVDMPDFDQNTAIEVQVNGTAFTDLAGNPFAGIAANKWIFTTAPDLIVPNLVKLTPAHTSINVNNSSDLEIEFDENVVAGTGDITIYNHGSAETITIPALHDSVQINGSKVTIKVPDFAFAAQVSVVIGATAFTDKAGNFFTGIPAGNWTFIIQPLLITPATFAPASVFHDGSGIDPLRIPSVSIEVVPNLAGTSVALYTRGISSNTTDWVKHIVTASENSYSLVLPTDSAYHRNKMGIEYYFEVTPPAGYGNRVNSSRGIVNIVHENGIEIPMIGGSKRNQYRLISIPLTLQDSTVEGVLVPHLQGYNIEKWRLYRYEGEVTGYQEYSKAAEFTSLQTGRAYWILAREGNTFLSGKGATLPVSQDKPYLMRLRKGWNLIGNPYDMHVSWDSVREDSINTINAPGLGELFVYEGEGNSYNANGNLMAYSGGFVKVEEEVTIRIPLLRDKPLNGGRMSAEKPLYNQNSLFEVNFMLENKQMRYRLAGLGMHPMSKEGHDRYDRYLLPRFNDYLDIRFASADGKNPDFTKHMVPVAEEYTWEFTIETNQASGLTELRWENYIPGPDGRQLFLYDVQQEITVNMLDQNSYKFTPASSSQFRVLYGSPLYISKHLRPQRIKLNQNVPNPFRGETLIPFSLPDGSREYGVEVIVYTTTGVEVTKLASRRYQPGFHQLKWNGTDKQGNPLPAGLYIVKLVVAEEKQNKEMFIRLIIQ